MVARIKPLWAVEAVVNFGRPAIGEGTVIFGDMAGDLICVNVADGTVPWQIGTPGGIRGNLTQFLNLVHGTSLAGTPARRQTELFVVRADNAELIASAKIDQWPLSGLVAKLSMMSWIVTDNSNGGEYMFHLLDLGLRPVKQIPLGKKRPEHFVGRDQELILVTEGSRELRAVQMFDGTWRQLYAATRPIETFLLEGDIAYLSLGDTVICVDLPSGRLRWSHFLDSACSGLHLLEDMLFVATYKTDANGQTVRTGADTATIRRLDPATGVAVWQFAYGSEPPGSPAISGNTRLLISMAHRPATGDARPYRATFFVIDAQRGTALLKSEQAARPEWIVQMEDVTVVGQGDFVYGFDIGRLWKQAIGKPIRGVHCNDQSVIALTSAGSVHAFAPEFGDPQWSANLAAPLSPGAVTAQDLVLVGEATGLTALHKLSGAVLWRYPTDKPVASPPVVTGDKVIFGCRDEYVRAVRIADHSLAWSLKTEGFVDGAVAVAPSGWTYITSGDGMLYCVDDQGTEKWRYDQVAEIMRCRPFIGRSAVFVGDVNGYVHAVDLLTGEAVWKKKIGISFTVGAVGMEEGTFWIADDGVDAHGRRYIYNLAEADGEDLGGHASEGGPLGRRSEMLVDGTLLYVLDEDGSIRGANPEMSPDDRWHSVQGRSLSGMALGTSGLAAGNEAGFLHFFPA